MIRALPALTAILLALFAERQLIAADDAVTNPTEAETRALMITLKEGNAHAAAIPEIVAAIHKAGELKLCAAVPDVVQLLTLRDPAVDDPDAWRADIIYPAALALSEIGSCSLPALVEVIKDHQIDSLHAQLAERTIESILKEKPKAVAFLKEAASKEKNSGESARRLNHAAQQLESTAK